MQARPITAQDVGSSSGSGAGGQTIVTGTPTARSVQPIMCAQNSPYPPGLVVISGTFTATLVIETSYDGGTTWNQTIMIPVGQTTPVTSITTPGSIVADIDGATNVRARCTAYTSGTANVALSPGIPPILLPAPALSVQGGVTSNLLRWALVPGATSYDVWRGTASGAETLLAAAQAGPTYSDTSLTANTPYYYYIVTNNVYGPSSPSAEVIGLVLPSAPTSPSATGGTGGVTVAYSAPSAGAAFYHIYRGLTTGNEGSTPYVRTTALSYLDSNVVIGQTYYYVIKAANSSGESPATAEVSAAPTLGTPGSPAAAGTSTNIGLTWTTVSGATSYNIWRSTTTGQELRYAAGVTGTSFTDYGITLGVTYYYKISAVSPLGQGSKSSEVSAVAQSPPAIPTGLAAVGTVGGSYVSWTASARAATYDVQTSPDNSTWTDASLAQAGLSYNDVTGHLFYRVRANNTTGHSSYTTGAAVGNPVASILTWLRCAHGFTVGTWTDQSGAGHNATQATGGSQFTASGTLGTKTVVNSADENRVMDFAAIMPTTGSFTKVLLLNVATAAAANVNNVLSGTNSSSATITDVNNGVFASGTITGGVNISTGVTANAWHLIVVTSFHSVNPNTGVDTWQQALCLDGLTSNFSPDFQEDHATIATLSVGGLQGTAGFGFTGSIAEVMLTSSVVTAAEMNNITNMINATYATTFPKFTRQVLFIGDSITTGGIATAGGGSWPLLVVAHTASGPNYYLNKGRSGAFTSDLISDASTNLYPYTSCGINTPCTVMLGTNDLSFGGFTATQVYNNLITLCTGLKANGAGKIVVVGILPRAGIDVARDVVNSLLRSNWAASGVIDGFADVNTIPMGLDGANTDTTYYNVDAIHPNDTGHAALNALIEPILTAIW